MAVLPRYQGWRHSLCKKGVDTIIGRGVVTSSYEYDPNRKEYRHIHKVNWTHDKKNMLFLLMINVH